MYKKKPYFINFFKSKKIFKRNKGFALVLSLVVLVAITTMSVAMMGLIMSQSKNSVRSHQNATAIHSAEFAIESGRLWLVDQLTLTGTDPLIIRNTLNTSVSGECLALHGYTDNTAQIYYSKKKNNQNFSSQDTDFIRYKYEFYVQRIGYHTTINGYNYVPQSTTQTDVIAAGLFTNRRVFYRVIGCGFGPNTGNQIIPLVGYYSSGGDEPAGSAVNLISRELRTEGYNKP